MLDLEQSFYNEKINFIAGCDEAGRGPLCGPVVAAAVIFDKEYHNDLINDSKKLTIKKREELFEIIKKDALAYGIAIIDPLIIDQINIYEASRLGMIEALKKIDHPIDLILTDAMPLKFKDNEVKPFIKGDAKALCIAAASILAKVTRDKIMDEYDKLYPEYNFKKNKGYPTKEHLKIIKERGIIKGLYRESYKPVKDILYPPIKLF